MGLEMISVIVMACSCANGIAVAFSFVCEVLHSCLAIDNTEIEFETETTRRTRGFHYTPILLLAPSFFLCVCVRCRF